MINDILARIFSNQLVVFLVVIAVMLAFAEIGFRETSSQAGWEINCQPVDAGNQQH